MNFIIFILLVFILAYVVGYLFNKIGLPKLLGYLSVGIVIGNFFNYDYLISDDIIRFITSFALSIILLKAGLGLEKMVMKKIGIKVLILGAVPNIIEALILTIISFYLLHFGIYEALMFGFIISAVSPAVVIPSMTKLMDDGYDKEITTLNLGAIMIGDVISLTMFSVFLALYLGDGNPTLLLLMAPVNVILGGIVGGVLGWVLGKLLRHSTNIKLQILQFLIVVAVALVLKEYGHYLFIIEMIAVISLGFMINDTNKAVGTYLKKHVNNLWLFTQVFLFFIIGFLTDLDLIGEYLVIGVGILSLGLLGRTAGIYIALHKTDYTYNQKHFSSLSNLPKATVQAALGVIPLSYGVTNGDIILSLSALAIIITAPLGLLLIEVFSVKLLTREPLKVN